MSRRPLIIFGRSGRMPQDDRAHYLQEKRYSYQRQQQRQQQRQVTLNRQTQRTQQQIVDLTAQIAQLERQLQEAQQTGNTQDSDRLREQLERCTKSKSDVEQRLDTLQRDLQECRQTLAEVENNLEVERQEHSMDQKQNEVEVQNLKSKNEGLQNSLKNCEEQKRQVKTLTQQNEMLRKQLDAASKSDDDDLLRQLDECTEKLKKCEKAYAILSVEHTGLKDKFDTFKASKSKLADVESKLQEERDRRSEELEIANAKLQKQNKVRNKEMTALTNRLNLCKMDERENVKKIDELQDEINRLLKEKMETGESKIADATDNMLNDLRTQVSTLKQELDVFNTMANNIVAAQQKAEQEKDAAKRKLEECESKISESKEDLEVTELRAKVAQMEANMASWNTLANDIVMRRQAVEAERDSALNNLADCEETKKDLEAQLDDLEAEITDLENSNFDKMGQIQDFAQKLKDCEDRLGEKKAKVERLQRAMDLFRAKFDKLKANVNRGASNTDPGPAPPAPPAPAPPVPMPSPPTVIVNPPAPQFTPEGINAIRDIRQVLRWYAIADVTASDDNVEPELSWFYESKFRVEFPDPYSTGSLGVGSSLQALVQDYRNRLYEFLKKRYAKITGKPWVRTGRRQATFLSSVGLSLIDTLIESFNSSITTEHIEEILKELDALYNLDLMDKLRGEKDTRKNDYPAIYYVPSDDDDDGGGGASKNDTGGGAAPGPPVPNRGGRRLGGNRRRPQPIPPNTGPAVVVLSGDDDDDDDGGGSGDDDDDDDGGGAAPLVPLRRSSRISNLGAMNQGATDYARLTRPERIALLSEFRRMGYTTMAGTASDLEMITELKGLETRKKKTVGKKPIIDVGLQPRLIF